MPRGLKAWRGQLIDPKSGNRFLPGSPGFNKLMQLFPEEAAQVLSGNNTPRMAGDVFTKPAKENVVITKPKQMNKNQLSGMQSQIASPELAVDTELRLPQRYTTNILAQDDIAELYTRSVAQATGSKVLHHPGEENLDAKMLTRFFTSNLVAELVARKLRSHFPNAQAEVMARPLDALDRHSDGGSDIAGLPKNKSIDIKYVGKNTPSNVTSRVGNQLEAARAANDPQSLLSFYQQAGGFIANQDVVNTDRIINRLSDRPQEFTLRGNILSDEFLDNHLRSRLSALREPQYHLPQGYTLGGNDVLVDYLMN